MIFLPITAAASNILSYIHSSSLWANSHLVSSVFSSPNRRKNSAARHLRWTATILQSICWEMRNIARNVCCCFVFAISWHPNGYFRCDSLNIKMIIHQISSTESSSEAKAPKYYLCRQRLFQCQLNTSKSILFFHMEKFYYLCMRFRSHNLAVELRVIDVGKIFKF